MSGRGGEGGYLEASGITAAVSIGARAFAVNVIIQEVALVNVAVAEFENLQITESNRCVECIGNFWREIVFYSASSLLAVDPIAVVQLAATVSVHPLSMCSVLKPSSCILVAVAVSTSASAAGTIMRPFTAVHVAVVEEVGAITVLLISTPFSLVNVAVGIGARACRL